MVVATNTRRRQDACFAESSPGASKLPRARGGQRSLLRDASGATAVEFAIVAPVLFLLMMGILEFGIIFAADIVLKNATSDAARTGRTGFVADGSNQEDTILRFVREQAGIFMNPDDIAVESAAYAGFDQLRKPEPFVDADKDGVRDDGENFTDVNGNGKWDADQGRAGYGGANEVVIYTVSYPWHVVTPLISNLVGHDGVITLAATAVVQNEPY